MPPTPAFPAAAAAAAPDLGLGLTLAVRPGDALGFRLAGATVEEIAPGDEVPALLELLARPGLAVLAVEAELLDAAGEALHHHHRGPGLPVVIPFAVPRQWADPGRGRELVAAVVRRAVGYHVKLGEGRT
jgi:V/A-type H+/Na+-transporting ATPase subunit F